MPREVVRAELVAGVVAELRKVLRPLLQLAPPATREVGVALCFCDRRKKNQHVSAFLDGHPESVVRSAPDGLSLLHAVVLTFRHWK